MQWARWQRLLVGFEREEAFAALLPRDGTHLALPLTLYYAAPGYPAVAIQVGFRADKSPVGFVLTAKRFDDAKLIRAAYALEQATKAWRPPDLTK